VQSDWLKVRVIKWTAPPKELHSREKSGVAELIVHFPDGQFGSVACYLIQKEDGAIVMSRGDGFVVKAGHWSRSGIRLAVDAQTVYREVAIFGQPLPEPWQNEAFLLTSPDVLKRERDNALFRPLRRFDDLDFLARVLCDRRIWDGRQDIEGQQPVQK
jgi:hypothetical protein